MNIVGIIAEYNPMHNGHIYHIKKAKELANADFCIVIMSGSFTEQGNVAVLDKFTRAKLAIENGADLVIELPTIYATSSAENFARGAVNILNSLGCITHLAFGAETDNIDSLQEIARTCVDKENQIIATTKKYLKLGITSAQARDNSLKHLLSPECYDAINKPNNILGIEYLKALYALKSQIKPVLVKRLCSSHNDLKITNINEYTSSTAIRAVLSNTDLSLKEKIESISNFIPQNIVKELEKNTFDTNEKLWEILKFEILKLGKEGLENIAEVSEGLENKLYDAVSISNSYLEYISNVKSKRYTLSRIKRICIYILLGITKNLKENLKNINYCRILKVKESSKQLLSLIASNATNKVITRLSDNIEDAKILSSIKLDLLANDISHTISKDYTNNIIC